jgi:hypothetical protein
VDIENGLLSNRPSAEDELRYFDVSLIRVLEANLDDVSFQVSDKHALDQACASKQEDFIRCATIAKRVNDLNSIGEMDAKEGSEKK